MKNFVTAFTFPEILLLALASTMLGCSGHSHSSRHQAYNVASQPLKTRPAPPSTTSQPTIPSQPTSPVYPAIPAPVPSYPVSSSAYRPSYYSAPTVTGPYAGYYSVSNFIDYMAHKHGFSKTYLNGLFSRAHRLESVIRLESPEPSLTPSRPGSWTRYRNKFLTENHINNGADFWRDNASAIQRASAQYGVDPEYIVAIIGVETYFGRNIGKTRTFDSLTTLAFDTHRRSKFFASELEQFLLMTREEGFDPLEPVGSWAGAMGLGQFMPSSFRKLAVDFNRDGRRDLWHEHDAIGSVAHYFAQSGWQLNSPVARPSNASSSSSVIELSTYEGNEYWRIYPNFKVIKRYNNSNKYAMAVHQLSQAIKQRVLASSSQVVHSSSDYR